MTARSPSTGTASRSPATPLKTALLDIYKGFLDVSHNGMALLGTAIAVAMVTLIARADLRADAEQQLLGWLLQRQDMVIPAPPVAEDPVATERVSTLDPADLPKAQANVAQWLSRKYRVAPEPLSVLVAEAFTIGQKQRLDPTLILAVMAIESRFNPYAQSPVGAQGLMQVLTRVHDDKYEAFGGNHAAFDPLTNLRVGVVVLRECIERAGGSLEGGLKNYVGAANLPDDGGYAQKVTGEAQWLRDVAKGRAIPWTIKAPTTTTTAAESTGASAAGEG